MTGVGDVVGGDRQLVGKLRRHLHEPVEDVDDGAAQRVRLGVRRRRLGRQLHAGHQVGLGADEVQDPEALEPLHHEADAAVGRPGELVNHAHRADAVEVVEGGGLGGGVPLGHERDEPIAAHHVVDETYRAGLPDDEGDRGQRQDDGVAQRKDRQGIGNREIAGPTDGDGHQRPPARLPSVMRTSPRS